MIPEIDCKNKTDISNLFKDNLDIKDCPKFINTEEVTNIRNLFYGCKNLVNLNGNMFDTRNVTNFKSAFAFTNLNNETLVLDMRSCPEVDEQWTADNYFNKMMMCSLCKKLVIKNPPKLGTGKSISKKSFIDIARAFNMEVEFITTEDN